MKEQGPNDKATVLLTAWSNARDTLDQYKKARDEAWKLFVETRRELGKPVEPSELKWIENLKFTEEDFMGELSKRVLTLTIAVIRREHEQEEARR